MLYNFFEKLKGIFFKKKLHVLFEKNLNEKTEMPLNCSETMCRNVLTLCVVLKAFIKKQKRNFRKSLLYNEFKKLSKKTNSSKNSGNP